MNGFVLAAYLAAQSADTATTLYRLRQPAVYRERGIFMPAMPRGIVLTKIATTAGTVYACELLKRKGHRRAAKLVYGIVAGISAGAAIHNARTR